MKRICIYVTFSLNEKIADYVYDTLEKAQRFFDRLIVIKNGKMADEDCIQCSMLGYDIICRENIGYDAGAYRFVLLELMSRDSIEEYDELTLMNDSFYGPFISFEELYSKGRQLNADFWGITKWYGGTSSFFDYEDIPCHIQSYFLVFSHLVMQDDMFWLFWDNLSTIFSFKEVVINFEVGISKALVDQGYKMGVLTDLIEDFPYIDQGIVSNIGYAEELVVQYGLPILKRKAVPITYFHKLEKIYEYLNDNNLYDISIIHNDVLANKVLNTPFSYKEVLDFSYKHSQIYVYGNGQVARGIIAFLKYSGRHISGIIVSDKSGNDDGTIPLNEIVFEGDSGIILALGRKNAEEVLNYLDAKKDIDILIPDYCRK